MNILRWCKKVLSELWAKVDEFIFGRSGVPERALREQEREIIEEISRLTNGNDPLPPPGENDIRVERRIRERRQISDPRIVTRM